MKTNAGNHLYTLSLAEYPTPLKVYVKFVFTKMSTKVSPTITSYHFVVQASDLPSWKLVADRGNHLPRRKIS